jgi:hypothetical protein
MVIRQMPVRIVITILFALFFVWIADPARYYFLNDDLYHIPLAAQKNFVHGTLLRPVSDFTLWLDHLLSGKNAYGYHVTNAILHLLNTLLVYVLAKLVFSRYGDKERSGVKSWLAALLFLVYAFHSEPIFWIIGRGGSLSTLFFLVSCICYLKRDVSAGYFFVSLLSFGVGLFAYESIWVFPAVAFFFSAADVYARRQRWKKEWAHVLCVLVFFLVFLIFRRVQTGGLAGGYEMATVLKGHISGLVYNYNALLARSFLPPVHNAKWFTFMYGLLWGFLIIAFYTVRKKDGLLHLLLAICFLVALTPAVSLGISTHNSESERYIYLPSVFLVLWLTEIVSLLVRNTRTMAVILVLVAAVNGYGLWQASRTYQLAGDVVKKSLALAGAKEDVRTLYLIHLPSQYEGALIFRHGFGPAADWICPELHYERLVMVDMKVLDRRPDPFTSGVTDLGQAAGVMGWKLVPQAADSSGMEVKGWTPGRDMILYWTDSTVMKIRE